MKNLHIHLALILVSVLFGINYIIGKFLLVQVGPAAWSFVRPALTGIILSIAVLPRLRRVTGRQWIKIFTTAVFGVVINQICFFEGLYRTTATHSAVLNTSVPIFTMLFSILFRYERMSLWRAAGMTLSVMGVLVVLEVEKLQFSGQYFLGDALTVINCLSFSLYLVLSKPINREISPIVVTAGMFLLGACMISFYGLPEASRVSWFHFHWTIYVAVAFSIIGATIGTYYLNNWALSRVDSSAVAIYIYIQPIVAGFLSRILYGEVMTTRLLIGTVLVFSGVAVGTLMPLRKKKEGIYVESHS